MGYIPQMKRLTQPMRQVLRNLIDGRPVDDGLTRIDASTSPANTVLNALLRRGLVRRRRDLSYEVTALGQAALAAHETAGKR